ncbi:hypothetical protein C9374_001641 [Naegleria lovaniensis]|uniref:Zn(2)-C6 fungal-type domain-containing protein n=1 Tax=Naegleria lovaniensis TaxID=51637 RepID=A0AA88KMV0_NAELO|nr:uncharacterized protein C9374_001641 [Naegleria lovaniensis]KAG2387309.1 hypothetical protein C9374_001641 [Naegleria lovaniensis]
MSSSMMLNFSMNPQQQQQQLANITMTPTTPLNNSNNNLINGQGWLFGDSMFNDYGVSSGFNINNNNNNNMNMMNHNNLNTSSMLSPIPMTPSEIMDGRLLMNNCGMDQDGGMASPSACFDVEADALTINHHANHGINTTNNTSSPTNNSNNMSSTQGKSNTTSNNKEKKKPKIACVYCNKLHKKCDGEAPNACTRCKKKGIPCVYLPPQKRGPKSKKRKNDGAVDEEDYSFDPLTCAAGLCSSSQQQTQQQGNVTIGNQQFQQGPYYYNQQQASQQLLSTSQQQQTIQHQPPKAASSTDLNVYINELSKSNNPNASSSTQLAIPTNNWNNYQPSAPSPLSGLQFIVNVHTRTLVDQFLDSVTCHSLVDRSMLDNALNKAVAFSSEPSGSQLLTNIVCAMGAQRLEDRKNCIDFFNRARNQASYLFDRPSRETSCALSLMGIYACSEGERIKGHMYNKVALDMASDLCGYQLETDKFWQSLFALTFATTFSKWLFELNILKVEDNSIDILAKHGSNPNHPQIPAIRDLVNTIKNYINSPRCAREVEGLEGKVSEQSLVKGSEEITFTALLVYYLLISRLASLASNQVEYISILRKLEILERYIESENFNRDDLQKNVHRFCLYSLRADILVKCGLDKMGMHCATKATGLAAKPTFWKSAPVIILFFPTLIRVNLNVNDSSMSVENYKALKVISSKFVVLKYTLFDMINAMNKRPEFKDLLESERQHIPQGFSNSSGFISVAESPQCDSAPAQDWSNSFTAALVDNSNSTNNCNTGGSCFPNDLTDLLQQLGQSVDHQDYQNKLEYLWQSTQN